MWSYVASFPGVAFTPPSSIAPASVTVAGMVAVSNFPATQPVSGTVAVSNFPATQPVSGSVSVSNFPATQPVSGTVTANQGSAGASGWLVDGSAHTQPVSGSVGVTGTVLVDGSAVTQPVSVASLPLPTGAATEATLDRVKRAANDLALAATVDDDLAA